MKPWHVLAALLALAAPAGAHEAPEIPILQANGAGEVMAAPDIAIVTIGVVSRAANAGAALAANSADVEKVIAAIRAGGVADKDIGTSGFSVFPLYEEPKPGRAPDQPAAIVGYQVSNEVRVTIRDIGTSGGILDAVVKAGANQVHGIAFDLSNRKALGEQAIAAAIADARRKGELMAEAAGVKLVRMVSVNANENSGGGPVFARADMAAMKAPVMPGERAVSANASITWEIAPK